MSGRSRTVLVLNCGSSSLKYAVVEPDSGSQLADGIIERIGAGPIADHEAALRAAFDELSDAGLDLDSLGLFAVGHRVVHGGPDLYLPTVVDDALVATLETLAPLAPLHNPPAILGIEVARKVLPDLPHVAVFDTAYFHDLPTAAATYAIPRDVAAQWHIRRYGFHGTSHQYVSEQAAVFLERRWSRSTRSCCTSATVRRRRRSSAAVRIDTSMGLTPMEGLVMGTRSGDVDPGVIMYLNRTAGMSMAEIETMLNRSSGVLGLGGEIDFRLLHRRIESGDAEAQLAYEVYIHRLRKYIGAYLALLGTTDVITFTAGVGENDAAVRRDALSGLAPLGVELDEHLNDSPARSPRRISFETSPTTVLVIPTERGTCDRPSLCRRARGHALDLERGDRGVGWFFCFRRVCCHGFDFLFGCGAVGFAFVVDAAGAVLGSGGAAARHGESGGVRGRCAGRDDRCGGFGEAREQQSAARGGGVGAAVGRGPDDGAVGELLSRQPPSPPQNVFNKWCRRQRHFRFDAPVGP